MRGATLFSLKLKRILACIATLTLLAASNSSAFASAWDFPNANNVPVGSTLIAINESSYFDNWNTWQSIKPGPFTGIGPEQHICSQGPDKANCDPDIFRLEAQSILPVCANSTSENCVEGIRLKSKDGEWTPGEFTKMIEGTTYVGKPEINLISAATPSLFQVPGITNGGGSDTYSVAVKVTQFFDKSTGKYKTASMNAVILPFTVRNGGTPPLTQESAGPDGVTRIGTRHDASCAWAGSGYCGVSEDYQAGTRAELTVRIPNEISGWFRGRITRPTAEISKLSPLNNKLVLSAEPVYVPRFSAYATADNTSPRGIEMIKNNGGKNPNAPLFSGNSIKDFWATDQNAFELVQEFRLASRDTAAGISTLWNFSTIQDTSGNRCMNDTSRVLGIVSTNATVYNGLMPDFVGGQLTYKVAGLHYAPDGISLNEGTYDLMMRSDVARCLYGFTSAPVSANISVVSDSGENKVASTVVNESDGWLTLRAAGFTYSMPTIKIKLTQLKQIKKTILCSRGNITKKVVGISPSCPRGYKKK